MRKKWDIHLDLGLKRMNVPFSFLREEKDARERGGSQTDNLLAFPFRGHGRLCMLAKVSRHPRREKPNMPEGPITVEELQKVKDEINDWNEVQDLSWGDVAQLLRKLEGLAKEIGGIDRLATACEALGMLLQD